MLRNNGWSRALDLQMDQLKWQSSKFGEAYTISFFEELLTKQAPYGAERSEFHALLEAKQLDYNVRTSLHRGDTIFVTSDMLHILLQAANDLPSDATIDLHKLITPIGFAVFEEPLHGRDKNDLNIGVSAILWHETRSREDPDYKAVAVYFFTDTNDALDDFNKHHRELLNDLNIPIPPLSLCHFFPIKDGATLPEGTEPGSEIVSAVMKLFWSMQLLAQQRIGEPIRMNPDRATRKRFQREWPDSPQRMITLITLRRKSVKKDGEEPQKIPWSRRWVVKGHWRRQPDKNGWHWTYIYEYVKGPEDKPLIITERRVFNFRR